MFKQKLVRDGEPCVPFWFLLCTLLVPLASVFTVANVECLQLYFEPHLGQSSCVIYVLLVLTDRYKHDVHSIEKVKAPSRWSTRGSPESSKRQFIFVGQTNIITSTISMKYFITYLFFSLISTKQKKKIPSDVYALRQILSFL